MSKLYSEPNDSSAKVKDPAQRAQDLFRVLKKSYALDKKLRSPKMYKLLRRVREGRLEASLANDFVRTTNETYAGPIGRVLVMGNTPHTIHHFAWISLPSTRLSNVSLTGFRMPNGRISVMDDRGRKREYPPSQWVFGVLISKTVLSIDLRQWPVPWLNQYVRQLTEAIITAPVKIKSCQARFFDDMTQDKVDRLRQANLFPSQAQKKKIRREQEVNQEDLDSTDEFSSEY